LRWLEISLGLIQASNVTLLGGFSPALPDTST
jgi:hypothetical protein